MVQEYDTRQYVAGQIAFKTWKLGDHHLCNIWVEICIKMNVRSSYHLLKAFFLKMDSEWFFSPRILHTIVQDIVKNFKQKYLFIMIYLRLQLKFLFEIHDHRLIYQFSKYIFFTKSQGAICWRRIIIQTIIWNRLKHLKSRKSVNNNLWKIRVETFLRNIWSDLIS